MSNKAAELSCEIEVRPGEKLELPDDLLASIGPGRWVVTVRPLDDSRIRSHSGFLNSYAPEDEGLYDDLAG